MDGRYNTGYLLSKAALVSKAELNDALEKYDVTAAQWGVLLDVYIQLEFGHSGVKPKDIADRMHSDRPTVTAILKRLKKRGFLVLRSNPEDGRSQLVTLTDEARDLIPKLKQEANRTIQTLMNDVEKEEADVFQKVLQKIVEKRYGL